MKLKVVWDIHRKHTQKVINQVTEINWVIQHWMHLYTYRFTCVCVLIVAVVIGCCSISISKLKCCHPASHLSFICSGPRLAANNDNVCHLPPAAPVSVSISVSVSVTVSVVACPILSSASFLVSCWFWINLFCSQVNPQSQSQPLSLSPYPMRCISGPLRHKRRQQKKTRERERERLKGSEEKSRVVAQVTYLGQGELQVLQRHRQRQPGNDIWSISWYDINSTHEHVVLLFIEFSDILKALTLKQIIMITRFIAAGQRNIRIIATRKGERNEWEKKTATKYKTKRNIAYLI